MRSGQRVRHVARNGAPICKLGLPKIGSIVRGVVESIGAGQVSVKITAVDGASPGDGRAGPCPRYTAVIHKEDTCFAFKDDMLISNMFRPGDLVLARVMSFGNAGPISLSTSEDSLGVTAGVHWDTKKPLAPKAGLLADESGTIRERRKIARSGL